MTTPRYVGEESLLKIKGRAQVEVGSSGRVQSGVDMTRLSRTMWERGRAMEKGKRGTRCSYQEGKRFKKKWAGNRNACNI